MHNGRVCRFHLRLSGVARRSGPVRPIVVRHVAGPIGRNVLRLGRFCRRGDFHRNWRGLHALALLLAHFRNRDGPAAIGLDELLLLLETSRRRRWRCLRHDATALEYCGGPNPGRRAGTEDGLLRRRGHGRHSNRNWGVDNFPLVDFDHVLAHGLSRGEGLMGSGGHRAGNALVDILDVADADVVTVVDDRGVVDVSDIRVVDGGIRYVHVIHVRAANLIRRHVDLARPQWEPRHTDSATAANANPNGEVRAADPGHERGRVDRPNVSYFNHCRSWRARHPAPHTANDNPTSVMERREAPRLIVNPSPSPGRDPNPVAVAVRSPSNYGSVREPDVAILGHGPPATVIIEILVADHVSRDVARRDGALFAAVAVAAPVIEIVFIAAKALHVGVKLFIPEERAGLPRMNRISRSTARDFAFAIANKHGGRVARLVHINAVAAGTKDGKRQVWSVNLKGFIIIETAHANINGSFGDADLRDVVREVQEGKAGAARQADRRRTDVQLCAGPVVSPKLVAGRDRPVHDSVDPVVGARGIEGNGTVRVAEARDAAGRVILIGGGALRDKESHGHRQAQQAHQFERVCSHVEISPENMSGCISFAPRHFTSLSEGLGVIQTLALRSFSAFVWRCSHVQIGNALAKCFTLSNTPRPEEFCGARKQKTIVASPGASRPKREKPT